MSKPRREQCSTGRDGHAGVVRGVVPRFATSYRTFGGYYASGAAVVHYWLGCPVHGVNLSNLAVSKKRGDSAEGRRVPPGHVSFLTDVFVGVGVVFQKRGSSPQRGVGSPLVMVRPSRSRA